MTIILKKCALHRRGGWRSVVDVKEVSRLEIKCRQYLPLMAKFAHVFSAPGFPLLLWWVGGYELWIFCSCALHLNVVPCGCDMQWEDWLEYGRQSCVPLSQWILSVVLKSVFWCWVYQKHSSLLSHLWFIDISSHSCWCLICVRCCGVGIPQAFSGGMSEAHIFHIPIVADWW